MISHLLHILNLGLLDIHTIIRLSFVFSLPIYTVLHITNRFHCILKTLVIICSSINSTYWLVNCITAAIFVTFSWKFLSLIFTIHQTFIEIGFVIHCTNIVFILRTITLHWTNTFILEFCSITFHVTLIFVILIIITTNWIIIIQTLAISLKLSFNGYILKKVLCFIGIENKNKNQTFTL